ncbi:RNA polymerase sigma factor [bacterium]|nr:RNA polymerase sigma factor [bacterium]
MQRERFERALSKEAYEAAWRYSCRLCRSREDAEDLLQESLARAFTRHGQLKDPQRFKGWLLSIVRSGFLNRYQRQRREDEQQSSYWYEHALQQQHEDPLALQLADAMARLPQQHCEVLGLFYLDGLSIEETGQVMGLSANVVRQRLFRARAAMRSLLNIDPAIVAASQEN